MGEIGEFCEIAQRRRIARGLTNVLALRLKNADVGG
jgi:hypothetical protein